MEKKVDVDIRFYELNDDENIVKLLTKTFPKWAVFKDPLKFWRWKYINTPQRSVIIVVLRDDKIVGCNHSIVFKAKVGSEVVALSWNDDLAVDIDFRG